VEYLGHIISSNGVATNPSKIQDIINWKTPKTKTIKQLRGFLGLAGYYRRFIPHYALICQPLHNTAMPLYEKEALAILEAMRKWRHYFLGNKLLIKTDQCSLKYLASQRLLEGIQHKLMLKLFKFDYSIQEIPTSGYRGGRRKLSSTSCSNSILDE
jgi:hypothetical protein